MPFNFACACTFSPPWFVFNLEEKKRNLILLTQLKCSRRLCNKHKHSLIFVMLRRTIVRKLMATSDNGKSCMCSQFQILNIEKKSELSLQVGTWKWSQILSIRNQELTWVICLNSIQLHKVAKLNLKNAEHAYMQGGPIHCVKAS